MFSILSRSMVGLDIRPHGLYIMQLRISRKRYYAVNAESFVLPHSIFTEGKITEWDEIQNILQQLVKRLGLTGMSTAIHLPSQLVHMQQFALPMGMKHAAIQHEIRMKLAQDFGGIDGQLAMDFDVYPHHETKNLEVHYAITRKEYVTQYINCVNASGLKVKSVDIDVLALQRVFPDELFLYSEANEVHGILVEINDIFSLLIFSSREIHFHHEAKVECEKGFLVEIEKQISIFLKNQLHFKPGRLVVYSQYQKKFSKNLLSFEVYFYNPFLKIILSPQISEKMENKNLTEYLLALGLAMRGNDNARF